MAGAIRGCLLSLTERLRAGRVRGMRRFSLTALGAGLAVLGSVSAAPLPDSFSERARELLADRIELNKPEDVGEVKHKLNVIYFIGSDAEPVADYERRISELLLYLQQFYGKEMARNGFGNRSVALPLKENGEVDITLIRGKQKAAEYPYSGEAAMRCLKEIDEYFREHPEYRRSQHNFVIMPTQQDAEYNDDNPGGVPFFGFGRHCFALDYKEFDLRHLDRDTRYGHLLTKWYGGFAHELGHGLNMPHNNGPDSELKRFGTPLMGSGNYTFGYKPTYMTKASCAILDVCEVFPGANHPSEYYTAPAERLSGVEVKMMYEDGALKLKLQLPEAGDAVKAVNVYVQDPPGAVNQDYDAVAFTAHRSSSAKSAREGAGVTWTCTVPMAELSGLSKEERELGAIFLYPNGFRYRWSATFKMSDLRDGQPVPLQAEQFRESSY